MTLSRIASLPDIRTTAIGRADGSPGARFSPLSEGIASIRNSFPMLGEIPPVNAHESSKQARGSSSLSGNVDIVASAKRALEAKAKALMDPIIRSAAIRTLDLTIEFYSHALDLVVPVTQAKSSVLRDLEISKTNNIVDDIKQLQSEFDERKAKATLKLDSFPKALKLHQVRQGGHRLGKIEGCLNDLETASRDFKEKFAEIYADPIKRRDAAEWLFSSVAQGAFPSELDRVNHIVDEVGYESADELWNQLTILLRIGSAARELSLSEGDAARTKEITPNGYDHYPKWLQDMRVKIDGTAKLSGEDLEIVAGRIAADALNALNDFKKSVYVSTLATISALANRDSTTARKEAEKTIIAMREFNALRDGTTVGKNISKPDTDLEQISPGLTKVGMAKTEMDQAIDSCKKFHDIAQSTHKKDGIWSGWTMPGNTARKQVVEAMLETLILRVKSPWTHDHAMEGLRDSARKKIGDRDGYNEKIALLRDNLLEARASATRCIRDSMDYKEAIKNFIPDKEKSKTEILKKFDAMEIESWARIEKCDSHLKELGSMMSKS